MDLVAPFWWCVCVCLKSFLGNQLNSSPSHSKPGTGFELNPSWKPPTLFLGGGDKPSVCTVVATIERPTPDDPHHLALSQNGGNLPNSWFAFGFPSRLQKGWFPRPEKKKKNTNKKNTPAWIRWTLPKGRTMLGAIPEDGLGLHFGKKPRLTLPQRH